MKILLIISLLLNIFLSFCGLYLSLELKKKEESEEEEEKHGIEIADANMRVILERMQDES